MRRIWGLPAHGKPCFETPSLAVLLLALYDLKAPDQGVMTYDFRFENEIGGFNCAGQIR